MMYHIKKDILGTWNLIHVNGKGPSWADSWVKDLLVGIYNTNYHLIFTFTNWSKTKIVKQGPEKVHCFLCGQSIFCFWAYPPLSYFWGVLASNWNMSIFNIVLVSWLMIGWESSNQRRMSKIIDFILSVIFPINLLELIGVVEKVWDRGRFRNEVENTWRILLLCQVTWTSTFWKALKTYSPPEIKDIFRCPLSWPFTKLASMISAWIHFPF